MTDNTTSVVEFNSNVAVLIRVNNIISAINDARFRITRRDMDGRILAEPEEIVSHCICLYKEIMVELNDKEKEIWNRLKKLRDSLRINPPRPTTERMSYWRKVIDEIDEIDLELRELAKAHGFLSANKKDMRKAIMMR